MDVFGKNQNLRSVVDGALERADADVDVAKLIEDGGIDLTFYENNRESEYAVFEKLFHPLDGELSEVAEGLSYVTRRVEDIGTYCDNVLEVACNEFSAQEIQAIQRASVDESFAAGFDQEVFKNAYREVVS